jgi:hypothetical protein
MSRQARGYLLFGTAALLVLVGIYCYLASLRRGLLEDVPRVCVCQMMPVFSEKTAKRIFIVLLFLFAAILYGMRY